MRKYREEALALKEEYLDQLKDFFYNNKEEEDYTDKLNKIMRQYDLELKALEKKWSKEK